MRKFLIYIFLMTIVSACDSGGDDILSKSKMEQVFYDYHLAQAMITNLPADERYKAEMYMNAVYEENGITKEQFDSSVVWYNRHAEDLEEIYDNLNDRFTVMNEELQLQTGRKEMFTLSSESGDTVNIWSGSQLVLLRNRDILNRESFRIKSDTSFYKGDKFIFKADGRLINSDKSSRNFRLTICFGVKYKDGKVISQVQSITRNDTRQLTLNTDEKEIDELFGYFYYNGMPDENNFAVVNNIQLIKMHKQNGKKSKTIQSTASNEEASTDSIKADSIKNKVPELINRRQTSASSIELREKSLDESNQIKIKERPSIIRKNTGPQRRLPANKEKINTLPNNKQRTIQ